VLGLPVRGRGNGGAGAGVTGSIDITKAERAKLRAERKRAAEQACR